MLTESEIQSIGYQFAKVEGEKAEVFDVMYANFDKLLDTAAAAPQLLAACEKGEDMLRKLISLVLASGIIAEVEEELPEHCGDEYGNNSTLDKMTKAIDVAKKTWSPR